MLLIAGLRVGLYSIGAYLLLTSIGCHSMDSTSNKIATEKQGFVDADGVQVFYSSKGKGDTCLLFVHGWGIHHGYWQAQQDYFATRYQVVTIDLPGFGKSGKNRKLWSTAAYAKDVLAVIQALGLKKVILVGHSMSGTIVVETALQAPQTILQVIGIDNMRDIGTVVGPEAQASYDSFYTRAKLQFREVVQKEMGPYLFAPSTDSTIRLKVLGDILQGDPIRSMEILAAGDQYPLTQKLKMYAKPIYLIQADYIPTDPSLFQKEGIPVRIRTIKNCGHYPMAEHPEEFNSALEATILQVQQ